MNVFFEDHVAALEAAPFDVIEGEYLTVSDEDVGLQEHKALEDLAVVLHSLIEHVRNVVVLHNA